MAASRLASVAGLPDYTINLGSYDMGNTMFSPSSFQNQSLPLSVNIMAAAGCDFMILNLVELLHQKDIVKTARAGPVP